MALKLKLFICMLSGAAFADGFPRQKVETARAQDSSSEETGVDKDALLKTYNGRQHNVDTGLANFTPKTQGRLSIDQRIQNAAKLSQLAGEDPIPNDLILVEMDMLYKKEDWAAIKESISAGEGNRHGRKAARSEALRWTNKTIPYDYKPNIFDESYKAFISKAFDIWKNYTCLNFRPAQNDTNYIYFQNAGGCSSWVGMNGGKQEVNLGEGCKGMVTILHEIGHALGLQHEQSRPDRDAWVSIVLANVEDGQSHNFDKMSQEKINQFGILYDYRSIMHYGEKEYSKNGNRTLVTKDPHFQRLIGHSNHLSFRDIRVVNEMYVCNAHCPNQTCPGEGFVGKDCQCWCPGNPVQVCGKTNPEVPNDCEDQSAECPVWAKAGDCQDEQLAEYMSLTCSGSCKLCNLNCIDKDGNCDYYSHINWCESARDYMTENCSRSCRFCNPMNS